MDSKPCTICGAEVRLEPHTPDAEPAEGAGPVGPADGVVGTADPTVDDRICTNPDCASHSDPDLTP